VLWSWNLFSFFFLTEYAAGFRCEWHWARAGSCDRFSKLRGQLLRKVRFFDVFLANWNFTHCVSTATSEIAGWGSFFTKLLGLFGEGWPPSVKPQHFIRSLNRCLRHQHSSENVRRNEKCPLTPFVTAGHHILNSKRPTFGVTYEGQAVVFAPRCALRLFDLTTLKKSTCRWHKVSPYFFHLIFSQNNQVQIASHLAHV